MSRFNHDFQEFDEVESKGCLRCHNYLGYGVYKIKDLPDNKVEWGTRVYCKLAECKPDLKPIPCNNCMTDMEKAIKNAEDDDLKHRLKELGLCPRCYQEWREACLCLLCHFDYPNSSIPGRKGNYCFCNGCEWVDLCPEKRKSFSDCWEMCEISKEKVEEITELI